MNKNIEGELESKTDQTKSPRIINEIKSLARKAPCSSKKERHEI